MNFLDDNFLLDTPIAQKLYHQFAKNLPIIDYHSHVIPQMIAENSSFNSITELWLGGDHYKWRLMRNCGIDENFITGSADDKSKFKAFASIMPLLIGNPMYVWCHLELKRYFGYNGQLNENTADEVFELCNKKLASKNFTVKNIIKNSNVELICTTDDPIDDLRWHKIILKDKNFTTKVAPSFRPDKAINITAPTFIEYLNSLSQVSKTKITDIKTLLNALVIRLNFFVENGCFITDHGLTDYTFLDCDESTANKIFMARLNGETLSCDDVEKYQTYMLVELGKEYSKRNLTMQLHFSCLRNPNTKMFNLLGADSGFDTMNISTYPIKLAQFLDKLNNDNNLPKTIIYSLDEKDNRIIETIINAFQGNGIRGKIQHGSAWWFNDTKFGMLNHFKALAEDSVLGNFIGMLTDSRSFVSYTRHEYFRRIACSFIARQVETGEYPEDDSALKLIIENISYNNAKNYFGI